MRRHNKTKKSKGSKRKGMKGLSLIKNTTKKVIPGLKTGLENIGSTVIKKTIPTTKNFFSIFKMKTNAKSKKSYKRK